ncbi:MAG: Rrf2 family transcriptional regulator [Treponema sp.]|nr:Rrf2 family transcriptional regulator [Treponema sp.]
MKLNTNLTVAIHTILCIAYFGETNKVTSDFIAASTGMNPVIIRKILGKLQSASIVETKAGVGGSTITNKLEDISLLDIYKAVSEEDDENRSVFNFHLDPNPKCPVGKKIHQILDTPLSNAQKALEEELSKTSVKELLEKI